jgi:ABC-type glycerol-3-phosphate transport system substrate-binding protein
LSWLNSFNALPLQKPATTFTSKKSTAAFDYLLQLQKSSCAWNSRQAEPYDYFTARQALAYSGVMQDIMPQTAAFKRSANQDNWTLLAYPADGDQSVVTDGSSYAVVKSDAENQMASWLFIRWISTPQNQARILQTSGTLPLGSDVLSLLSDFKKQYPQWAGAAALEPLIQPTVRQANAEIIQMVLEDAGWQLFKTDLKTEQIPAVLIQLDEMIKELTGRNP